MKNDLLHQTDTNTVKALVNWVAAFLGIGTFLGVVNLAVGALPASWMDTCNAQVYAFMMEVLSGTRELPESPQIMIDALPAMQWPE